MDAKFILTRTIVRFSSVPTESVIYPAKLITFKPVQRFNDVSEWSQIFASFGQFRPMFRTWKYHRKHSTSFPGSFFVGPHHQMSEDGPLNYGKRLLSGFELSY